MKQFIVMCAVLPLLLILAMQISLDQINSFRLMGINDIVYSYAEKAKQEGYFDCDGLKAELNNKLHISEENIMTSSDANSFGEFSRGSIIHYSVIVRVKRAMLGLKENNEYSYVINSSVASEFL